MTKEETIQKIAEALDATESDCPFYGSSTWERCNGNACVECYKPRAAQIYEYVFEEGGGED